MSWLDEARERLLLVLRRRREDREMDEELRYHLDMATEANVERGMEPGEARRRAMVEFGSVEGHRERLRDGRRLGVAEDAWRDLRFAARALGRRPGYALIVCVALALGIGTSTAIYSLMRAVVTDAIPFPDADRLFSVVVGEQGRFGSNPRYADLRVWRGETAGVVDLAGHTFGPRTLGSGTRTTTVWTIRVTERFFQVLEPRMEVGRPLLPADASPAAENVAVISPRLWQGLYGGDPGIVGRGIEVGGQPHVVVGVLEGGFEFPAPVDVWVPLRAGAGEEEGLFLNVIGKLAPGATRGEAQVALETIQQGLDAGRPAEERRSQVTILPLTGRNDPGMIAAMLLIGFAVGSLLLIGIANGAGLMLTRSIERAHELAIRSSLGASRLRVAAQLLVESTALALAAGALGVAVAYASIEALRRGVPEELTEQILGWARIGLDLQTLAFAVTLSVGSGVAVGSLAAVRATRGNITAAIQETSPAATTGRGTRRILRFLLGGQVAIAITLLLCAGLLTRSLLALFGADPGFRSEDIVTARWELPASGYQEPESVLAFQERLLGRVAEIPGVQSAEIVSNLPPTRPGFGMSREFRLPGSDGSADDFRAAWRPSTPGYLRQLDIPLLSGRHFTAADGRGAPQVAIVSDVLARRHWPGGDPLGSVLSTEDGEWTVVGVVRDLHDFGAGNGPEATIYVPQRQAPTRSGFVVARAVGSESRATDALEQAIWGIDPAVAVSEVQPLASVVGDFVADARMMAYLMGVYATMAFVITLISLYGAAAYFVTCSRRELGVRVALGARPGQIVRAVMARGFVPVIPGLLLGVLFAAAIARLIASILYGVRPLDPVVFGLLPIALLLLAAAAMYLPARRASRVDPITSLRSE